MCSALETLRGTLGKQNLRDEAWVHCLSSPRGTWRELAPSRMEIPSKPGARCYCMLARLAQGNMYQKIYWSQSPLHTATALVDHLFTSRGSSRKINGTSTKSEEMEHVCPPSSMLGSRPYLPGLGQALCYICHPLLVPTRTQPQS